MLVSFVAGDPDQPIIIGRVFNATQTTPYKLPENKTRSTWKSDSSLGSDGFNEIMFEDLKGHELVWVQAQNNRRRLVKNDEFITVVHDRQKKATATCASMASASSRSTASNRLPSHQSCPAHGGGPIITGTSLSAKSASAPGKNKRPRRSVERFN